MSSFLDNINSLARAPRNPDVPMSANDAARLSMLAQFKKKGLVAFGFAGSAFEKAPEELIFQNILNVSADFYGPSEKQVLPAGATYYTSKCYRLAIDGVTNKAAGPTLSTLAGYVAVPVGFSGKVSFKIGLDAGAGKQFLDILAEKTGLDDSSSSSSTQASSSSSSGFVAASTPAPAKAVALSSLVRRR